MCPFPLTLVKCVCNGRREEEDGVRGERRRAEEEED